MIRFLNNFSSTLTTGRSPSDPQLVLPDADAQRIAEVLRAPGDQVALTLDDGTSVEVLYAYEVGLTGIVYVNGAQEGTLARNWPAGTSVQARLTEGVLASLPLLACACLLTDAEGTVLLGSDGLPLATDALPTSFGF